MKTILVNLLGAAGSGKSTLAADIFVKLKRKGYNCEYVKEYAKDLVYEENFKRLKNQLFIFSNQYYSLDMLRGKVDIIITDSPLLLSIFYNEENFSENSVPVELFNKLVLFCNSTFDNLNYFIKRNHEYKQEGRYQDEKQAKLDEEKIIQMINSTNVDCRTLVSTDDCATKILSDIEKRYEFYKNLDKNGQEIERKFFVDSLPANLKLFKKREITQAYLNTKEHETRVRSFDGKEFYLTEKYGNGLMREEFEKKITKTEFEDMLSIAGNRVIYKTRYYYPLTNLVAEIDCYHGKFEGLQTVEVEFSSLDEAKEFQKPSWFGDELTNNPRYKNKSLAENGTYDRID